MITNEIISFTPSEVWGWVLAACVAIVTIAGAAGVISKIIIAVKKPNKDQNQRLENLEKWFETDKKGLASIEDGNRVTQRAILALLDHGLGGNNTDQMRKAKDALQTYLTQK